MKNRKLIFICIILIICLIIFFVFFKIFNYKNTKMGNNISDKTLEQIEAYILNISSYEAEMNILVESNKNSNKYIISQKYVSPNILTQTVIEPKNIEGLTVKYDGANLQIMNSKLNLNTIYENYKYVADNVLWLSDFIENYKNNSGNIIEEDGMVIMETKCSGNRYLTYEKLYINRDANKIEKLVILDENNKTKIYITYNKIEIDSLNKDNILAFKTKEVEKTEL